MTRDASAPLPPLEVEDFPCRVQIVPDHLDAVVHDHRIKSRDGEVHCWTYVSHGLTEHDQKELVLTLRRDPDAPPSHVPVEPLHFFHEVLDHARRGQLVDIGSTTQFGDPGILGRQGVVYAHPTKLGDLPLPDDALAALLVERRECATAEAFGVTRLLTRLGRSERHFPYPPWSDPQREPLDLPDLDAEHLLAAVPRLTTPGVMGVRESTRLVLRLTPAAGEILRQRLLDRPNTDAIALLLELDPAADGCLVWGGPDQDLPSAITPEGSQATTISGSFLALLPADETAWTVVEDGFLLALTEDDLAKIHTAITDQTPVMLEARKGRQTFWLEWVDDAYRTFGPTYGPEEGVLERRSASLVQAILLTPEDTLTERISIDELADYIRALSVEVHAHFDPMPESDGHNLFVEVELSPERLVLGVASSGLDDIQVLGLPERLQDVNSPTVRGPIKLRLEFSVWGGPETT